MPRYVRRPHGEWTKPRRMAQDLLEGFVMGGFSGIGALRELRKIGRGYRTAEFYEDWRRVSSIVENVENIRSLGPDEFVPDELIATGRTDQPTLYRYNVVGTQINPDTGEEEEKWLTLDRDRYMTRGSIEEEAEAILSNKERYPWEMGRAPILRDMRQRPEVRA